MSSSIGLKAGYEIFVPFNPEAYDGFPINLCLRYKKINLEGGVIFGREMPGKEFKASLGYGFRLQYEIAKVKKGRLYLNYSFEKLTHKQIISNDGNLLDKYVVHNCLGFGVDIPIIHNNLFAVSNIEMSTAYYYFPDPYPGNGKYNLVLIDFGFKYCFNLKK